MSHLLHGSLYNNGLPNRPPPCLPSQLPPVLLSKSHLSARGHSLGLPRMWQHHTISKVPHLTAPLNKHASESFTQLALLNPCIHKSLSICTQSLWPFIKFCYFQKLVSQIASIHTLFFLSFLPCVSYITSQIFYNTIPN